MPLSIEKKGQSLFVFVSLCVCVFVKIGFIYDELQERELVPVYC